MIENKNNLNDNNNHFYLSGEGDEGFCTLPKQQSCETL